MEEERREDLFKVHKIILNFAERIAQLEGTDGEASSVSSLVPSFSSPNASNTASPSSSSSSALTSSSAAGSPGGPRSTGGGRAVRSVAFVHLSALIHNVARCCFYSEAVHVVPSPIAIAIAIVIALTRHRQIGAFQKQHDQSGAKA